MRYLLALSLLLFPAVAPASSATPMRIYEDGSYITANGDQGCLPLRLCQ